MNDQDILEPFFLATTALEDFWDTSKPIVFLGDWCLRNIRKEFWEPLGGKIISNPWDQREQFLNAARYVDEVYEKLLPILAEKLNEIHYTNHSLRYWRIVIGPWLSFYVPVIYDRYILIKKAINEYQKFDTIGLAEDSFVISKDSLDFQFLICDDPFNLQIYTLILHYFGRKIEVKSNNCSFGTAQTDNYERISIKSLNKNIKKEMYNLLGKVVQSYSPIILKNPYFTDKISELKIFLKSKGRVWSNNTNFFKLPLLPVDINTRLSLMELSLKNNEFEKLLVSLLPKMLPQCYMEGYDLIKKEIKQVYPSNPPKAIFSANSWYFDEVFKQWAGDCVDSGTKLCGMQHGGCYGVFLYHNYEEYEISITDRFYTWGWDRKDYLTSKIVPFYANKLVNQKKIDKNSNSPEILFAGTPKMRYLFQFRISFEGNNEYLAWQFRFAETLNPEIREKLRLRLHYNDWGLNNIHMWEKKFPEVFVEDWSVSFMDSLKNCRLYICDHLSTTYLEALAINKPTIIFCNPRVNELRPDAQKYHDELRAVGILYDSPENAADAVNNIYFNLSSWWNNPELQAVREKFCYQFARTAPNALDYWVKEFKQLIKSKS